MTLPKNSKTKKKSKRSKKSNALLLMVIGVALILMSVLITLFPPFATENVSQSSENYQDVEDQHGENGIPYPDIVRVTVDEVFMAFEKNEAIIVDVRSTEDYQAGHMTGAISMPLSDIEMRYQELPVDKMVFLYCT